MKFRLYPLYYVTHNYSLSNLKCNAVNLKFDKYAICIPSTAQRQLLILYKPPTLSVLTLQQLLGANRFAVLPFGDPITRISISN